MLHWTIWVQAKTFYPTWPYTTNFSNDPNDVLRFIHDLITPKQTNALNSAEIYSCSFFYSGASAFISPGPELWWYCPHLRETNATSKKSEFIYIELGVNFIRGAIFAVAPVLVYLQTGRLINFTRMCSQWCLNYTRYCLDANETRANGWTALYGEWTSSFEIYSTFLYQPHENISRNSREGEKRPSTIEKYEFIIQGRNICMKFEKIHISKETSRLFWIK